MLISEDYQNQQREMHEKIPSYGKMGMRYGEMVGQIIDNLEIDHLLDYGCGHNLSLTQTLKPKRKFKYQGYDPGVEEYSDQPNPAEMVCCIDVLEHIEPDCIEDVLDHLEELTEVILFATVHTGPAGKVLPDGRNAHLIQQPMEWWLPKFMDRFTIQGVQRRGAEGFEVIAHNADLKLVDHIG